MSTNFGAAAADYARFRLGFPDSFFERLTMLGVCRPGTAVVDVGTGTGALGRGFALRGATVIGIDPDERLMEQARKLDASASVYIDYKKGIAEAIPLNDAVADLVMAGQCWHWFDGPKAAREFARILKPGRQVLVAHFNWLPHPGSVVDATERLIKKHNPRWRFDGGNGFQPESLAHLHAAGFRNLETFSYDIDVPYTHEGWRGRIRASAGIGATLDATGVQAFDDEHRELLATSFPGDNIIAPHRIFAVIGRSLTTDD